MGAAVSLNSQQYTGDGVSFRYFSLQTLDGILPSSGPVVGGTTVAVFFSSKGAPLSGASEAPAGTITARRSLALCHAPPPHDSSVAPASSD